MNCVVRRDGCFVGENTDGQGFLASLRTVLDPAPPRHRDDRNQAEQRPPHPFIADAVTHEPVAVLDVSTWRANLPSQAAA